MAERVRRARGDRTRARLLAAALEEFDQRGFAGASTRHIAERVGISPSALYAHHRSKEDLLFLLAEEAIGLALRDVQRALTVQPDPARQLAEFVRLYVIRYTEDPQSARVVARELDALSPEHRAEVTAVRKVTTGLVRAILERGVEIGDFHITSVDIATTALFSLSLDVTRWWSPDGTWAPEELGQQYSLMALRMVGVRPDLIDEIIAIP